MNQALLISAVLRAESRREGAIDIDIVRRALAAQPAPVPHGWKLVPVEPTPEMALAYGKTKAETGSDYDAMKAAIAASPEKP